MASDYHFDIFKLFLAHLTRRVRNITQKTKHRETRTPIKTEGGLGCSGRVSSSWSTCDTRCVTVKWQKHNPDTIEQWYNTKVQQNHNPDTIDVLLYLDYVCVVFCVVSLFCCSWIMLLFYFCIVSLLYCIWIMFLLQKYNKDIIQIQQNNDTLQKYNKNINQIQ
jgi:ABC-type bacteriocin/lantibiotic exporter with double-glycine peptidase domain